MLTKITTLFFVAIAAGWPGLLVGVLLSYWGGIKLALYWEIAWTLYALAVIYWRKS